MSKRDFSSGGFVLGLKPAGAFTGVGACRPFAGLVQGRRVRDMALPTGVADGGKRACAVHDLNDHTAIPYPEALFGHLLVNLLFLVNHRLQLAAEAELAAVYGQVDMGRGFVGHADLDLV